MNVNRTNPDGILWGDGPGLDEWHEGVHLSGLICWFRLRVWTHSYTPKPWGISP